LGKKDYPSISGAKDFGEMLNGELRDGVFDDDASDRVSMAGFGPGVLVSINQALSKFGRTFSAQLGPTDLLAYAFLSQNFKYDYEFSRLPKPILFKTGGKSVPVAGYGVLKDTEAKLAKSQLEQVRLRYLRGEGEAREVILQLKPKVQHGEQIYIAMVKPERTLSATIQAVFKRIYGSMMLYDLNHGSTVKIPVIDFNISREYKEIEGKKVSGLDDRNPNTIAKAVQDIRFKLDEKGMELSSEAEIIVTRGGGGAVEIVIDRPFLVILEKDTPAGDSMIYFATWAANDEILKKPGS
jgi:hypothetical protein